MKQQEPFGTNISWYIRVQKKKRSHALLNAPVKKKKLAADSDHENPH